MQPAKVVLALCLIVFSASNWAFYCGHQIVSEGDTMTQVLEKCGEPDQWQSSVIYQSNVLNYVPTAQALLDNPMIRFLPDLGYVIQTPIQVEEWLYDFGRRRFRQFLRFHNSRLMTIESRGYGTD